MTGEIGVIELQAGSTIAAAIVLYFENSEG